MPEERTPDASPRSRRRVPETNAPWWSRWWKRIAIVVAILARRCSCRRLGPRGQVHREQQVLRHRLPRDVAVPRHLGEVDAQERRLRQVPHRARAGQLRAHQDVRLARGLGALHRRLQEAHQGHAAHPQLRLRPQRLPHQRPDQQDHHAGHAGARHASSTAAPGTPSSCASACHAAARPRRALRGSRRPPANSMPSCFGCHKNGHHELQLLPQAAACRPGSVPELPQHGRLGRWQELRASAAAGRRSRGAQLHQCHTKGTAVKPDGCINCHGDHHNGLTNCVDCHKITAWIPSHVRAQAGRRARARAVKCRCSATTATRRASVSRRAARATAATPPTGGG